ncbi:MAG: hypothetical protein ACXIVE_06950 [Salinarimonas sp.]
MDGAIRHRRDRFARPAPRERFLRAYQGFAKKATLYSHDIHIDTSQNHNVATSAMSSSSHATMRPTLLHGERIAFFGPVMIGPSLCARSPARARTVVQPVKNARKAWRSGEDATKCA